MLKQLSEYPTRFLLLAFSIILLSSACGSSQDALTPTLAPATETSAPPTATPVPAAATVNGEIISLEEFNAELLRFQQAQTALGISIPEEDASEKVLNDLIDQVLLAQGAQDASYSLKDEELDTRLSALTEDVGGEENLSTWLANHGYTRESFRPSVQKAAEAAWMRDKILTELPSTAEQVHAQQILLYNRETADDIKSKLDSGTKFADLASAYDPKTNGELGWFPRNYLLDQSIENAAFSLEVGQVSDIIETEVGFHIIMILEHETERSLSPDALLALSEKALLDWLENARKTSTIEK